MYAHNSPDACRNRGLQESDILSTQTRELIESTADLVAQKGPAYEQQLRRKDTDSSRFPFLHLDHAHARYYQEALCKARAKAKFSASNCHGQNHRQMPSSHEIAYLTTQKDLDCDTQHDRMDLPAGRSRTENHAEAIFSNQTERRYVQPENQPCEHYPGSVKNNPLDHTSHQLLEESRLRTAAQIKCTTSDIGIRKSQHARPAQLPSAPLANRYDINQEVHLLDSNGTDQSGLATYIIVDDSEQTMAEQHTATPKPSAEPSNPPTVLDESQNLVYRVRACTSTIFRTVHSRLLPVGFALGAEVKQSNNPVASIVIRRIVEHGKRLYDVKDELGIIHKNVAETDLAIHVGGSFSFRAPDRL